MESIKDLELLVVTILSAVMFVVLYYLFVELVGVALTIPMAAIIGGLGSAFGYSATRMLFSQKRRKK